jgi:hypothetical protein
MPAMNLASSPILKNAAEIAGLSNHSVTSLLQTVADGIGVFPDDSPHSSLGLLMSGLTGIAAALAVAILLTVYFRTGYRTMRDVVRHGLAAALALGLLAFVVYDMRHSALAYLGINPTKPAVEFEIRLPKAAATTLADSQVELHTDRNQTLAQVQGPIESDEDGRSVLKGSVALDFRTTDRVVILDMPGQFQCQFKLRLAANPSRSDEFGPWHLADRVASLGRGEQTRLEQNDAFAIRYRVL